MCKGRRDGYDSNALFARKVPRFQTGFRLDPGFDNLSLLGQGVVAFAKNIGGLIGAGTTVGLSRLESLTDGKVKWSLWESSSVGDCFDFWFPHAACLYGLNEIQFKRKNLFASGFSESYIRGAAVHEMAHAIHALCQASCQRSITEKATEYWESVDALLVPAQIVEIFSAVEYYISPYANKIINSTPEENWAEAVTVWVYGAYSSGVPSNKN